MISVRWLSTPTSQLNYIIHRSFLSHAHTQSVRPTLFLSPPVRIKFTKFTSQTHPDKLFYRHSKLTMGRSTHFCESVLSNGLFERTVSKQWFSDSFRSWPNCASKQQFMYVLDIPTQKNALTYPHTHFQQLVTECLYIHANFCFSFQSALTQVYTVTIKGQWRCNQAVDSKHPLVWGRQSLSSCCALNIYAPQLQSETNAASLFSCQSC